MPGPEPLVDAKVVAPILNCSVKTVLRLAAKGDIPAKRIGKLWKFRLSTVDAWVSSGVQFPRHPRPEEGS